MGMDLSTIIGPYIKIVKGKKKISETILSCPDKRCTNHKNNMKGINFCPICGSKISDITIIKNTDKDYSDFMNSIKEDSDLFNHVDHGYSESIPENCEFLFENFRRPKDAPKRIGNFSENGGILELEQGSLDIELNWFKSHYDKWIKKFKEYFGEENVTVGYGVISYWS